MSTGYGWVADDTTAQHRVGGRLRLARLRAGLTQAEVADRTGLSISFVRLVESGRSDISLSRLLRWTTLFRLPVAELFAEPSHEEVTVVRPPDRLQVPSGERGIRFELLTTGADLDLEPAIFHLAPRAEMQRPLTHEGDETAFVLQGKVRIWVGASERLLEVGDSACYSSRSPHRFGNGGDGPAELYVTTTHPALHVRAARPPMTRAAMPGARDDGA